MQAKLPQLKVMTVIGTRPEATKMAPVVLALQADPRFQSVLTVTAQHRELLDQVLDLFSLSPDHDLDIMKPGQTLQDSMAAILTGLAPVLEQEAPDWLLVQGDTTTVMAAAILGYYLRIRVAHVEAGLRSFNKWEPFPEEINRRVAGAAADLHFAPTENARQNLLREGISDEIIRVVGNTAIDGVQLVARMPFNPTGTLLEDIPLDGPLILMTAHRRENFGQGMLNIAAAVRQIAEKFPAIHIVYPIHPNPNVSGVMPALLAGLPNVHLLPAVPYKELVCLMKHSLLVLTDSGGLQEEAPTLDKPVLVMRAVTERPEGLAAGCSRLVGTDVDLIVSTVSNLLEDETLRRQMADAPNPYGDGQASQRILNALFERGN